MTLLHDIQEGVRHGIELEGTSSETCICSVVTHEVTMYCNTMSRAEDVVREISSIAQHAIMGVLSSLVPLHSFAVSETTRGVLHGLVCAGLDVSYVTRSVSQGIREALSMNDRYSPEMEQAIHQGIRQTLHDLGMKRLEDDRALDLPGYFVNQSATFGEARF
ncbi:MAG: hypothetical protein OWR52_13745 [Acidibacillus sp.]|uniref:Uncharacterized protein n=1 Tax=Sulfoacidibacillus ferrooxidans TaxID=2005001 RepID=A0A9X1VDS8_9BACL|nr:hypothetical protein [Sulfoacidibacillus ferrooxidans]MCI0184288.1 hypothetical protein [Sulfoacidibacillus ferrooxidans]MCY0894546.1 hypothetical protein [Acidibacillus sp.]